MSGVDLIVLGTASQAPTRRRNHNGYVLRWDREAILFDPGEGTQRQFTIGGVSPGNLSRICLTHLHGDHCLGLPGMLQRLALDHSIAELPVHFPASGLPYVERLCNASIGRAQEVRLDPVTVADPAAAVVVEGGPPLRITARPLDHEVDTLGWRVEEPPHRHFLVDRLEQAGVRGPDVGILERDGHLVVDGRRVTVDEVSIMRAGRSVAVVMDTRICDAAVALADGVDLLLCEATFLEGEAFAASSYGHLTAREAATIAREAGVGLLVLTHFSSRYPTTDGHVREAQQVFAPVVAAEDFDVIPVPRRE